MLYIRLVVTVSAGCVQPTAGIQCNCIRGRPSITAYQGLVSIALIKPLHLTVGGKSPVGWRSRRAVPVRLVHRLTTEWRPSAYISCFARHDISAHPEGSSLYFTGEVNACSIVTLLNCCDLKKALIICVNSSPPLEVQIHIHQFKQILPQKL